MITVANRKTHRGHGEYIGRPSILGNPFEMEDESQRAAVISQFRSWLWNKIKLQDPVVLGELQRLKAIADNGDLVLVCWCAPLPCHADVIKKCIEWMQSLPKTN